MDLIAVFELLLANIQAPSACPVMFQISSFKHRDFLHLACHSAILRSFRKRKFTLRTDRLAHSLTFLRAGPYRAGRLSVS